MSKKNKIKFFNSLKIKKYRDINRLFIAERKKVVFDMINSGAKIKYLLVVEGFSCDVFSKINCEKLIFSENEMSKISNLSLASEIIGIFEYFDNEFSYEGLKNDLSIFCDDIQNPGNFGTIIRTADWFGVKNIVCSSNSVDLYNSKVIQATAGSAARINIQYVDKNIFFENLNSQIPVYGTFLEGENIYKTELCNNGIVVLGNEGQGISDEVKKHVSKKIYIPGFPEVNPDTESLNVSIAAAITLSEFRRRHSFSI